MSQANPAPFRAAVKRAALLTLLGLGLLYALGAGSEPLEFARAFTWA